jgi:ABC-type uncharacterized transport system permease subunit
MFFRILYLISGVLSVYVGIVVWRHQELFYYGAYIHLGETSILVGIAIIAFGLGLLYVASRKSFTYNGEKYIVCPKCNESFSQRDVPNSLCPQCDVELEDLDGFYDRHPELREEAREED